MCQNSVITWCVIISSVAQAVGKDTTEALTGTTGGQSGHCCRRRGLAGGEGPGTPGAAGWVPCSLRPK